MVFTDYDQLQDERDGADSDAFCGTPEYVSPEVLRDQEAGRGCDLWALGVIAFQVWFILGCWSH